MNTSLERGLLVLGKGMTRPFAEVEILMMSTKKKSLFLYFLPTPLNTEV